ncbi:hypothetical protein [Fredinandcohnia onubensis]|uniref:hypothetical protein n=1 Tax=Fredinandcohnia onubensis TaxID=1571209 RepID=UPI000C0BE67A|nr:hypothetical protein [Fredinandcohnia onubensis]
MIKVILELIRTLVFFLVVGSAIGAIVNFIYKIFEVKISEAPGGWFVVSAILIFIFLLYKNWFQFYSFVDGPKSKLKKTNTTTLLIGAFLLLVIPVFL